VYPSATAAPVAEAKATVIVRASPARVQIPSLAVTKASPDALQLKALVVPKDGLDVAANVLAVALAATALS
jgi:hypothetical protein